MNKTTAEASPDALLAQMSCEIRSSCVGSWRDVWGHTHLLKYTKLKQEIFSISLYSSCHAKLTLVRLFHKPPLKTVNKKVADSILLLSGENSLCAFQQSCSGADDNRTQVIFKLKTLSVWIGSTVWSHFSLQIWVCVNVHYDWWQHQTHIKDIRGQILPKHSRNKWWSVRDDSQR